MSPPGKKRSQPIDSMAKLQRRMPVIVKALDEDPQLCLAAAANPILAIEEIGYELTDSFKHQLELRLRFPEKARRKLGQLKKKISEAAGRDLPLADADALHRVLFEEIGLDEPDDEVCGDALRKADLEPSGNRLTSLPRPGLFGHPLVDPLTVLAEAHPVMAPLLEYRAIEASEPRFASRSLYRKMRAGDVELPVSGLRLRMGQDRNAGGEP